MASSFKIIYADPPWQFKLRSEKGMGRSAENHYSCMSKEDLLALPVASVASKDCALFMWTTDPMLPFALKLMEAWGFQYKTVAFTWTKTTVNGLWHMGTGFWTRANPEMCLLGTRGAPPRVGRGVRQLVVSPVGRHSEKPAEVADRIVELCGDVRRMELFARVRRPGWSAWGNEV
jgi:N6-adenosine-specific RNA methylase IME4